MASPPRNYEREEERRLNMRTLAVASVASATAAAVTSQLWIHGTWIAAALTPVLVALISEAMHRPTERIARAWTSERPALGARAEPPDQLGPMRVYRQPSRRPARRGLAVGAVAATGAVAFVIAVIALTAGDLVAGESIGKGSGSTTLWGGGGDANRQQDAAPAQDAPEQQPPTEAPPPASEPVPEEPPTATEPTPSPDEAPPGEPQPDTPPSPY